MSTQNTQPLTVSVAAPVTRDRFVKWAAGGVVPGAAATDLVCGVASESGDGTKSIGIKRLVGVYEVEAGVAIAAGQNITCGADGRAAIAAAGNRLCGVAITAAAAAGEVITVGSVEVVTL